MEADISSQAVGLASSADFSLMNLFFKGRYNCKISNYPFLLHAQFIHRQ